MPVLQLSTRTFVPAKGDVASIGGQDKGDLHHQSRIKPKGKKSQEE